MPREVNIERFVSFSILLSMAVGVAGVTGCIFHLAILRTILPGSVAIAFNTSVCFILLSIALWCLRDPEGSAAALRCGRLVAASIALIGLLSLIEFLGNLDFGIDQLLFAEHAPRMLGHVRPGLMSPVTSLNLVLLASALLLLDWTTRRRTWPSQVLCFIAGIVGVFTLLDLALNPNHFHSHIALPTVTLLSLFPFAIICARPDRAMGGLLLAPNRKSARLHALLFSPREMGPGAPLHYIFALACVAAATVLRHWSIGYIPEGMVFIAYYPAVMIAALVGGLGPGILATVLSSICVNYFFLPPVGAFTIAGGGDLLALLTFTGVGIGISWFASAVQIAREEAAEAVRLHDAELRQAQHLAHLVFWTVEIKTGKVTWSSELYRILGVDPSSPAPPYSERSWLFAPESWERFSMALDRTTQSGIPCELELETELPNGLHGCMLTRAEPLFDVTGEVTKLRCIALDITERRRAEVALRDSEEKVRALNVELEARVQQRTAQLTSAIEELESFTYTVAHDLRAPLRTLSGFSKHVIDEYALDAPPELRHYLQRIDHGARQMGVLVDEVLNLARVNRQMPKRKVTRLRELVDEVTHSLAPDWADRRVEWKIGELPSVECDPVLMKQVFANLLSNAIKFTRPRDPAVIEVGQKDGNGIPIIYVRDNGVGFSMQHVNKLFGVFERLHRQDEFEGVGIGLATVQRIVQKHGGRVWAEGEVGNGATFYFTVGAAELEPAQAEAAVAVGGGLL